MLRLVSFLLLASGLLAPTVRAQRTAVPVRLSFEPDARGQETTCYGSRLPTGATLALDSSVRHSGRSSLRLTQPVAGDWASVSCPVELDRFRGATAVRVRGWMRTADVEKRAGLRAQLYGAGWTRYLRMTAQERSNVREPRGEAFENLQGQPGTTLGLAAPKLGPTGTTAWERYEMTLPVPYGLSRISVGMSIDMTGTVWLDDLTVEPVRLAGRPSAAARRYVEAALDTMQAQAFARDVDWSAFRRHVLAGLGAARTTADTYPALRVAVAALDSHGTLFTPELMQQFEGGGGSNALPPPDPIPAARLSATVGYVGVPGYAGNDSLRMHGFAESIRTAIDTLDAGGVCAWVVDLRGNTGGGMDPMIAGIGPLAATPGRTPAHGLDTLGGFVNGQGLTDGYWAYEATTGGMVRLGEGTPSRITTVAVERARVLRHADPPVAVLFGPRTGSSGEFTLVSLLGRPRLRTFGQPSAGYLSGNGIILLSDGAALNLTMSRSVDRLGRYYSDARVPPEVYVSEGPPGTALADDPVVRTAMTWLATQPCGRRE